MKKITAFFIACAASCACLFAQQDSPTLQTYADKSTKNMQNGISYRLSVVGLGARGETMTGNIYHKGDKTRIDIEIGTVYLSGKKLYMYDPGSRSAVEMPMDMSSIIPMANYQLPGYKNGKFEKDLVIVGSATLNGYPCLKVTTGKGKDKIDSCLTDEFGFPTYLKTKDANVNLTNFNVNHTDADFELPKGTTITSFGITSLIGNLFGAEKKAAAEPEEAPEEDMATVPLKREEYDAEGRKIIIMEAKPSGLEAEEAAAQAGPVKDGPAKTEADIARENMEKVMQNMKKVSESAPGKPAAPVVEPPAK